MKKRQELEAELEAIEDRVREIKSEIDALDIVFDLSSGYKRLTIRRANDGFTIHLEDLWGADLMGMACGHDFLASLHKTLGLTLKTK